MREIIWPGIFSIGIKLFLSFSILLLPFFLKAQLPSSQAWLLELAKTNDPQDWRAEKISLLSNFNKEGYNNQPGFTKDGNLLLSYGEGEKTDLIRLNIPDKTFQILTSTEESEFSPQIHPGGDYLCFVRLEKDGVQRIWKLPLNRYSYGSPLTPLRFTVGYYRWLDEENLALFLLKNDLYELIIWNIVTEEELLLSDKPGRCMDTDDKGNFYFVVKQSETVQHIYQYNKHSGIQKRLVRMIPGGSEDFCVGPDNTLLTIADGMLMTYRPGRDAYWVPKFEIPVEGVERFTRIASDRESMICIISK